MSSTAADSTAQTVRNKKIPVVAIAGATGAVGVELMQCLEQRKFPLSELRLLASARSAGKTMKFRGRDVAVQELTDDSLQGVDIALFSAGGAQSKRFAPAAVKAGAVVVDNSSAFRMDPNTPLVVPEINSAALAKHNGIIANPNCVAIVAATPLWPLHQKKRIQRITMSTYQAASGAGAAAMEELSESTKAFLEGRAFTPKVLPHPYAFNVFSHNTKVDPETGYNEEETKVMQETRKIFGEPNLRVTATCVRVPVLRAHCIALNIEFEEAMSVAEARDILAAAPGVRVVDELERNYFPMPVDASGKDEILVGRMRKDVSDPTGRTLALFVAGDQLRKGAALNAVQIAERLLG
jgi:aspartate-semialdehyde dehydrogenase